MRDIKNGRWVTIENEDQFKTLKKYGRLDVGGMDRAARVQMGNYEGPGDYYLLSYSQPCPRGCCYDDVYEVLTADEVVKEIVNEIRDLAADLRQARAHLKAHA